MYTYFTEISLKMCIHFFGTLCIHAYQHTYIATYILVILRVLQCVCYSVYVTGYMLQCVCYSVYVRCGDSIVIEVPRGSSQFLRIKAAPYHTEEVKVKLSLCMP